MSRGSRIEDTRLILVTDLGFIVKQAKDGSRDVFVQSIRTGLPVDGARVEIVGANGEPVLAATTDATGRAPLPSAATTLRREKRPLLIVGRRRTATCRSCRSASSGRELDLSRFDTGGVENAATAAAAVRLPVLGSRHLSSGRDHAPRA